MEIGEICKKGRCDICECVYLDMCLTLSNLAARKGLRKLISMICVEFSMTRIKLTIVRLHCPKFLPVTLCEKVHWVRKVAVHLGYGRDQLNCDGRNCLRIKFKRVQVCIDAR